MIFIDKMKNLKIYKTQMFLPTLEKDKKKKSAILLLTPNYESSKKIINSPLFVNRMRFSSYYINRDVSYYINQKSNTVINESLDFEKIYYLSESNLNNVVLQPEIPDNFLVKNGYEDNKTKRVTFYKSIDGCLRAMSSDIKRKSFYVHVPDIQQNYICPSINEAPDSEITDKVWVTNQVKVKCIGKIYIEDIIDNGLEYIYSEDKKAKLYDWKYNWLIEKSQDIDCDKFISEMSSPVLNIGDKLILFQEDAKNNSQLKKILFADRMKTRQEVLTLYDIVKNDFSFIKYTFPDLDKYQQKNVYIDLYYYTKIFFENNTWILNKGMNLFFDFMNRLINHPQLKENGYEKKTIFIPIIDWDKNNDNSIWNFRKSLNPCSLIYFFMNSGRDKDLINLFGKNDIIFVSSDKYFKINFYELKDSDEDFKKLSIKFKTFLIKICKNEEFDFSDIDTTADFSDSKEVIKANIIDKIEVSKGIDLTAQVADASVKKNKRNMTDNKTLQTKDNKSNILKKEKDNDEKEDIVLTKASKSNPDQNKKISDINKKKLADEIDIAVDISNSEDDAWDILDNDYIKNILLDLDSSDGNKVDISAGRAQRASELTNKLLNTELKGRSIKDILSEDNRTKEKKLSLNIASPNDNWKDLSFVNFDKNYDIDKDIISCFKFFETTSRPIYIRNINVTDNSTSEDRLELYEVEMEDFRGKRFTIKLDIPTMVDNRFLLRGYNKSIQTQFFNMPIIKTDEETCQIISNYMKIFVIRFGSGKSLPMVSKIIKASTKYKGNKIKFIAGNNTKVCTKYELPIDYIDLAGIFSMIETPNFIIYFNQDQIRSLYMIEEDKGIPYLYNKKEKCIEYIHGDFCYQLFNLLNIEDSNFGNLVLSNNSSTTCTYSRCRIMNTNIPLVVICGYHEGLRKTLDKAGVQYSLVEKITKDIRSDIYNDWIKFQDGYLVYTSNYESSLLLNGLKVCPTEFFKLADIDNKDMYLEFLDNFGGRIKADGLDNFYDCMLDPMTIDVLKFYKFPTDYVSILLYANSLLSDNKYFKHTNTASRRLRRYELIAVYTYKVLADAYSSYTNQLKHVCSNATFSLKQSAVIDKFLTDTITSDDSCINALRDVETTNAITTKGPSGMNSDRAYSLDKRTYDDSMLNILGMSTGFAANVGITRQATIDSNVETDRGYVKPIKGDTSKMNTSKTLTITEALTPFGTTRDDPIRTAMTFIQTSKHMVRTEDSDPLLVTNGSDEALAYLTTDKFAFKAKKNGKVKEIVENEYVILEYEDGTNDYINLKETIEKNSDGGYFVPLKLDLISKIKVGSKILEDQVIAYDKYSFSNSVGESDNIAYNIGKLAKVAIVNTDEGFEDSGVITEKMAKKLATRINLKFDVILDKDSILYFAAKVGDNVECGDDLMIWQAPFDDEDANSLLKTLAGDEVSDLGKRKLKSEVTGRITDIKIFRTCDTEVLSDSLRKFVNDYEAPFIKLEKKFEENGLDKSKIPAHYVLPPTGKLKRAQDAILVEYYVEYLDTVGVGDKIVYFSANKAVEKNIIPLGQEPYTDFRPNEPIDAFVSEVSIDKRMVCSSIVYGSIQKLMVELDRSVKDIMNIPYDDSEV